MTCYFCLCAGQYGRWSTDSCRVVSDDGATTRCVCTQLGHFGLLFVSKVAQFCAMQAVFRLSSMQPYGLIHNL